MQVIAYDYWAERSLFYLCKMFSEQIHEGEDYQELKKCIHVGILNFILFDDEEYYSKFHIWEDSRKLLYTDKMEIHIVELPKLKKYQYPETELLRWARFFNAENKEEMQMAVQGDKYMEKAYNRLVNLSADDEKRLEYEERQKAIRDYNHMINSGWRTGHARGYAEGHAEGLAEGHAEGHAEGRIQECIEILQEMGIAEEKIQDKLAQKFSLSEKEIEEFMEKYWKRAES